MRSGFVTLVGRPNVGKSSLLNAVCGRKVSIVSDKPQTTRTRVRAVVNTSDTQVVFVDTPGIHKPVSALGRRVNATAVESISEVDVACLVIDATQTFGRGDRFVAERMDMKRSAVVLNKTDATTHAKIAKQLSALAELDALAYFPVSARTGDGVAAWMQWLSAQMPEGQALFPRTREELPYSIATRVTEYEWPRIRCEIVVERESQKGMVIGKGGAMLKAVGTEVRMQLAAGAFLELAVVVDEGWQHDESRVQRLGY
ncbi:MAG: GTP-binding protein Era [Actinomycetota bacterium]